MIMNIGQVVDTRSEESRSHGRQVACKDQPYSDEMRWFQMRSQGFAFGAVAPHFHFLTSTFFAAIELQLMQYRYSKTQRPCTTRTSKLTNAKIRAHKMHHPIPRTHEASISPRVLTGVSSIETAPTGSCLPSSTPSCGGWCHARLSWKLRQCQFR